MLASPALSTLTSARMIKQNNTVYSSSFNAQSQRTKSQQAKQKLANCCQYCISSCFSMKFVLATCFMLQVIIITAVWMMLIDFAQVQATMSMANNLRTEVVYKIAQHVQYFISTPPIVAKDTAAFLSQGTIPRTDFYGLAEQQRLVRYQHPSLYTNLVIYDDGQSMGYLQTTMANVSIVFGLFTWNTPEYDNTTTLILSATDPTDYRYLLELPPLLKLPYNTLEQTPPYVANKGFKKCRWAGPYTDPNLNDGLYLPITCPIFDPVNKTKPVGMTIASYTLDSIHHYLAANVNFGKSALAFIMDIDGYVIADSIADGGDIAKELIHVSNVTSNVVAAAGTAIMRNHDLPSTEVTVGSDTVLVQHVHLTTEEGINWVVVLTVSRSEFLASVNQLRTNAVIVGVVFIAVSLVFSVFIICLITRPLKQLEKDMNKISKLSWGDKKKSSFTFFEIKSLQLEFNRMKKALKNFGKYVPLEVVRQLLEKGNEATCGLKTYPLSLFFSDIEGFTTMSEQLAPEQLVRIVERYFSEMTSIIIQLNGTIDKYIGDAIFAFFNAPERVKNYVYNAVAAAVMCQKKLRELEPEWVKEGLPVVRTRIGIASGDCLVGNMGSAQRINFTAIGDNVNLAARLEGLNKVYHTKILISESVYQEVALKFLCRPVDRVVVVGKTIPVQIFEVIDFSDSCDERTKAAYTLFSFSFECYLRKEFDFAILNFKLFQKNYVELFGSEDACTNLLIERCTEYIRNPPPKEWDGSYHALEK